MQLVDASEQDLEACLPLIRQLWPTSTAGAVQGLEEAQELQAVFQRLLENPDARIVLAVEDEQVVALMDLTFRETLFHRGWTMMIEDIVVDEAHRRRGIGRKLVQLAETIARQRGCHGVELSSDLHRSATHQFWEALGYQRKALQFRKELSA